MTEIPVLKDLVIILALGVVIVSVFHRFKIPAIAGFIVAGALVGPKGLALIADVHQVEMLAEIGVTLLLFGIGLEFPLDRLKRLWKPILIGGAVQVGLSIGVAFTVARLVGLANPAALLIAFVVALSSTAIVLWGLEQRNEVDTPHGRFALGVLIFQDLCVVPMILLVPILAQTGDQPSSPVSMLIRSAVIVLLVLVAARLLVPRLMDIISKTRRRHLFVMTVLLICIGIAWVTASAGVSLALGAFLAGLIVAGSEYRHQALSDIIPFRDVFTSLFFVSVGMIVDIETVLSEIVTVALLLVAIMVGKFLIVFMTTVLMRIPTRVGVMASAALAQVGEFSFVLMTVAMSYNLIDASVTNVLLPVTILSMILTPFALTVGPSLAAGVGRIKFLTRWLKVPTAEDVQQEKPALQDHVIVGGYGLAGHDLSQALRENNIPYLIADLNPENVHKARSRGEPAFFADITSAEVLERLGAHRAREFVIVINDWTAIERAVKAARQVSPDLYIMARTKFAEEIGPVVEAGSNETVAAEIEASVEITERVLKRHRVPEEKIQDICSDIRETEEIE